MENRKRESRGVHRSAPGSVPSDAGIFLNRAGRARRAAAEGRRRTEASEKDRRGTEAAKEGARSAGTSRNEKEGTPNDDGKPGPSELIAAARQRGESRITSSV